MKNRNILAKTLINVLQKSLFTIYFIHVEDSEKLKPDRGIYYAVCFKTCILSFFFFFFVMFCFCLQFVVRLLLCIKE